MFYHGFDNYMSFAWPADELKPISCQGRERIEGSKLSEGRGSIDAAMGSFQMTLIDSLDTLYIMGDMKRWKESVHLVIKNVKFDSNLEISVFETNIRIVGGLLANHLFALKSNLTFEASKLLSMAVDIADRLLPAFNTPTGIPRNYINLNTSLIDKKNDNNCLACSGTFLL